MIKALVVDDEKRVRKGFISLANWASYGIRIVGEAKDGASALEALGQEPIDLMFVDIGMPGMSGFELIEQARGRYPGTKSVILTCHHEFDYVQEALRLGAIDYIVKTLLNKNNVDETMHRIAKRYAWETRDAAPVRAAAFETGVVFVPLRKSSRTDALHDGVPSSHSLRPLSGGLWLAPGEGKSHADWLRDLPAYVTADWQAVQAVSVTGMARREAESLISSRLPSYLFYLPVAETAARVALEDLKRLDPPSESELAAAEDAWRELKWLIFTEDWKRFIEWVEARRIDPDRLRRFAGEIACEWAGLLGWEPEGASFEAELRQMRRWEPLKGWFSKAALRVQQRMAELSLSREVFFSLVRAIRYMKDHLGEELSQDDIARRVGMSRSYFSQCFKKFAGGELFGDTLRKLRIDRARELLVRSELPVREVAGRVGFVDEKYFSRVFRDKLGCLPSELRKTTGAGGGEGR
ncbi:response regulator [Cohnella zeiphila]|uniref:Response regulator n=1 Tax=Cohnella zeiphila TaxID=2761120 RepID=A0A7X0SSE8_9BACL|nr:response regulator [Cohnella zeiphila]MBB6733023.1 response regulator [Cohnella zeiphila]